MDKDERLNKINKISSDYLEHIKDRISVQLPISEMREIRKLSEREGIIKEKVEWVSILLSYAEGKKWDTGGVWVCERHQHIPFEMGYSFDCQCGAPGKPPFCCSREPLQEDRIKQFNEQFGYFEFGDAQGALTIEFARAIEKAHGIINSKES